jgi:hypothetical protein
MWSDFLHGGGPTRFGTDKFELLFFLLAKRKHPIGNQREDDGGSRACQSNRYLFGRRG